VRFINKNQRFTGHIGRLFGFTMLELLVVMTVVSILAASAIPTFNYISEKNKMESAVEQIVSDLQLIRYEAMKSHQSTYVSFTDGANWCYGLSSVSGCDCGVADSCQINDKEKVRSVSTLDDVSVTNTFPGDETGFEYRRGIAEKPGEITVTSSEDKKVIITLSPIGRITACSDDGFKYGAC